MAKNESKSGIEKLRQAVGGLAKLPKVGYSSCRPEVLLCENIPAPLHGIAPRAVLGKKWWDKTRQAAYKSTNYHCIACGVHKSGAKLKQHLEGHEVYKIDYTSGRMVYVETVPLCHFCHCYIHDGRLTGLRDSGQISHGLFAKIIQHGDSVLSAAGLSRLPRRQREAKLLTLAQQGKLAHLDNWRMVYGKRVFKPRETLAEMLRSSPIGVVIQDLSHSNEDWDEYA